ncbi:MAG: uroporphyrinogen-III C-methyltransferase [Pseudobacteriovorax sp.]|nr:uroporphyrinogen-III C-methyltransferase [Pseudobacteriovorax sp.]
MNHSPCLVNFVGAGSCSLENLTLGAYQAIQDAELILYDSLIHPDIKSIFPKNSLTIFVGKRAGKHSIDQSEICRLLKTFALQGRSIVRLKGGDPLVFSRISEEMEVLDQVGVSYKIFPGVSSMSAIASQLKFPLTNRDQDPEFHVMQGFHLSEDPRYWQFLAHTDMTIVIFMGMKRRQLIAKKLIAAGKDPTIPYLVAVSNEDGEVNCSMAKLQDMLSFHDRALPPGPGLIYIGRNLSAFHIQRHMDSRSRETYRLEMIQGGGSTQGRQH